LLSDQGAAPALSNTELLMLMYPRCRREAEVAFLLGTYMELVDKEVVGKQKELMVGTVRGVLTQSQGRTNDEQSCPRDPPSPGLAVAELLAWPCLCSRVLGSEMD
jgi:hypothetical protein